MTSGLPEIRTFAAAALAATAITLVGCSNEAAPASGDQAEATAGTPTPTASSGASVAAAAETPSSQPAPPTGGPERFYGKESFTIVYELTGSETGQVTEHVRDWGRRRVEITTATTRVAGFEIQKDTRAIMEAEKITNIDNINGSTSQMTNPLYADVVAALRGRDVLETGEAFMRSMGGTPTGESDVIGGETCAYWALAQLGGRACIAPWGATLKMETSIGGISIVREAKDVRIGDPGPDAAFAYDAAAVQAGPDLGELLKKL